MKLLYMVGLVLTSLTLVGCSGDRCGDGVLANGEDETTCCVDSGCGEGVCDPEAMACVDPWTLTCPVVDGGCSAEQPYKCEGELPRYTCEECGCGGDETCHEGVCLPPDLLALEHTNPFIPDDLPTAEYFSFLDANATREALTYEGMLAELGALLAEDRRRNTLLLGESHSSADEQAVAYAMIRDLVGAGWNIPEIGIEGGTPILDVEPLADLGIQGHNFDGDLTNDVHCDDVDQWSSTALNDEVLYVQYSGSGHTSREVCYQGQHWIVCDPPYTSDCVTRNSRKALVIMLFDPHVWLWQTDRVLLWRLPEVTEEAAFTSELNANITRWQETLDRQELKEEFSTRAADRDVNVRFVRAEHDENAYIAFFPRPYRPAYLHEVYRAIWNTPSIRSVLIAGNIHPKRCSVSWNLEPGNETLWMTCQNDTDILTATVDGAAFTVTTWSVEAKPMAATTATHSYGSSDLPLIDSHMGIMPGY